MRKLTVLCLSLLIFLPASAQTVELPLDSCIAYALRNNKGLRIAQLKEEAASLTRKSAFTNYLPKIDGMGAYMRVQKEISLLSDEQKESLSHMGNTVGMALQGMAMQNPAFGQIVQSMGGLPPTLVPALNGVGEGLVDALHTDTRNMTALGLSLTQPLYMGGKIVAYNNITKYAEQIAQSQHSQQVQELILQVETAYWQLVSLEMKKTLAESFKDLIDTLDHNVTALIENGMASKADGLSVRVKQNEAELTLMQIADGITLTRMLLSQLCGLDVNTALQPAPEDTEYCLLLTSKSVEQTPVATALEKRPELRSLELLSQINREKVKVVRSDFLPHLALNASYLWTNPSLFNGFQKSFKGTAAVGVMLNVPIFHWGEGMYKVKAAKVEQRIAEENLAEVREKITLQATQCAQKLEEARHSESLAQKSLAAAEENLRYANEGMKEGVIPISNVLEAQTAWLSAHSTLISARIDKRLAQLNVRRAMGVLEAK